MRFSIIVRGMPLFTYLKGMPAFLKEYREIRRQAGLSGEGFPFGKLYPCLQEKDQESGVLAEHYFYQDLYVARKLFQNNPVRHVDIGSRIDGFVAHVASFREIEVLDVRDLHLGLPQIRFTRADLSAKGFPLTDYCDSLSCLHALEHFGLGRYGDPVDYDGHLVGWENLHRMLKKGGKFYFSVPIGTQRIEFNAHRVFSVKYLLHLMEKRYDIDSFAYIDDAGNLISDAALDEASVRENFRCRYGCGIFELTKR
jgi:SAM-dependent methyltransferase